MSRRLRASYIGRAAYRPVWALQNAIASSVREHDADGVLILVEHPPTLTTGRRDASAYIHATPDALAARGFDLVATDRGGLVTYHGPGQLVGYPIVHLGRLGISSLPDYVACLEALMQAVCEDYGVSVRRIAGHPGLFAGADKIGAVGVHLDRQVSTHGFALNIAPDLDHYQLITACGLSEFGLTSLAKLGVETDVAHAARRAMAHAASLFDIPIDPIPPERLWAEFSKERP
jgi:lipoate-protein ligase B